MVGSPGAGEGWVGPSPGDSSLHAWVSACSVRGQGKEKGGEIALGEGGGRECDHHFVVFIKMCDKITLGSWQVASL